jgi:lipopolysaccharide/colanic/teichoic acid biosynthesis glycosyltransferase
MDIVVGGALLVLLLPVFVVIALAIRLDSEGPVFFRQRRCGLGFEEFTMNKFRTMRCGAVAEPHRDFVLGLIRGELDHGGHGLYKLSVDERVTRVGRVVRRLSLDELPQLLNVLRGEMTLVGPRPPIPYEVANYPPEWLGRLAVKPGLTGLWQVSGRNELNYDEMVQLDLEYVERRSLWLNLQILARTLWVVVRGRGAA